MASTPMPMAPTSAESSHVWCDTQKPIGYRIVRKRFLTLRVRCVSGRPRASDRELCRTGAARRTYAFTAWCLCSLCSSSCSLSSHTHVCFWQTSGISYDNCEAKEVLPQLSTLILSGFSEPTMEAS